METVTKCEKIKEWNGKPIYQIQLSDGRIGETVNVLIPVGTSADELQFTDNAPYNPKIKWNKPNTGGGGGGFNRGGQRSGNESFALSYAKDLAIAYVAKDKQIDPEKIVGWAEVFYNWMETKKKA